MMDSGTERPGTNKLMRAVGHELRGPLGGILQLANLILQGIEGEINDDVREDIEKIRDTAEEALTTVNKILALIRFEAAPLERSPHRVAELFDLVKACAPELNVESQAPDGLPPVLVNLEAMHQVFAILVGMRKEATLYISADANEGMVMVTLGQTVSREGLQLLSVSELLDARHTSNLTAMDMLLIERIMLLQSGRLWVSVSDSPGYFTWSLVVAVDHTAA